MDLPPLLAVVVSLALGYFIGGIPFGVVVAKAIGGPDPRTLGSGRTGGANTARALGRKAAIVAGLLDAAKGSVSALLPLLLGFGPLGQVIGGLASIVGHSRSPYIGFGGGRGIAPGFGALLVIQPVVAAIVVPIFLAIIVLTRISSIGSLTATAVGMVVTLAGVGLSLIDPIHGIYAVGAAALIWLFHIDNIRRLLEGRERRIDER